jgi:hypothetical protein
MALGSTGEASWSERQNELSKNVGTLEEYLKRSEAKNYGDHDFLYQAVQKKEKPGWIIPRQVFQENDFIDAMFAGSQDAPTVQDGVLPIAPNDPWLAKIQTGEFTLAFQDCAAHCTHYLVPLISVSASPDVAGHLQSRPLGFVLLDRPYPHHVELPSQLPFTRLVCDLFAGLLASRGFGRQPFRLHHPALEKGDGQTSRADVGAGI